MRASILIFSMMVLIVGCVTQNESMRMGNPNLTDEKVAQIVVGMEEQAILNLIGAPDESVDYPEGVREWSYRWTEGAWVKTSTFAPKTSSIRAKLLTLRLDAKGIVTNVFYDQLKKTEEV